MSLEAAVRKEIRDLDPTIPTTNSRSMEQVVGGALAARRFSLSLVGVFAVTALFLAAAALCAVIAYGIEQRTREIGVRMALGASRLGILADDYERGFSPGYDRYGAGISCRDSTREPDRHAALWRQRTRSVDLLDCFSRA